MIGLSATGATIRSRPFIISLNLGTLALPGSISFDPSRVWEGGVAKLKVMCGRSMHRAVGALTRGFEQASGHTVELDFGTMGALQKKLDAGERADVLILSLPMINQLQDAGALVPGSRRDVARTFVGVAVRAGTPLPDLSSAESFARTVLEARAVAFSDPAVGGSAGVYLVGLFERLGLAGAIREKGMPQQSGVEVARRVAEGKADIGLTLTGEIASVEGVVVAGPLPPPHGHETTYCAAVSAASDAREAAAGFIAALTAPATRDTWRGAGFDLPPAMP
jgi:molybdate transport system substrate-binding protein